MTTSTKFTVDSQVNQSKNFSIYMINMEKIIGRKHKHRLMPSEQDMAEFRAVSG